MMAKLLCIALLSAFAISTASARPHLPSVKQENDNDLVDLKNLGVDVNLLNSVAKRGNVKQINDNDLIDLKNLGLDVNLLNSIVKRHNVKQIDDNDLIDLKNLGIDVNLLNSIVKRGEIKQENDNDLIDLKDLDVVADILNTVGRRDIVQSDDNDLIDAKNLKVLVNALNSFGKRGGKKHSFKGKDGRIVQYNDNDLIDLKNLGVDLNILNSFGKRNVYQSNDDDLVDAKNADVDVDLLNSFDKRANVDAAFDVLRRANYDVDLLSISKRAESDMYQYSDNTHTCYCAKKASCGTSTPASFKPIHTAKAKTWTSASSSSTTSVVLAPKPTSTWSSHPHHHHHSSTSSARVYKPSSHSHHHHHAPTSSSAAPVRTPTASPTCPSGWKSAEEGDIIQENDNDLVDLKNLTLNINILNSDGDSTSKTVPATSKPKCTGKKCCYKTEKNSVVQKNDNDLIDAKNANIGVNLLNGIL